METGTLSVFKHEGWLGKGKDWSKKSVDIPAIERGKRVIDSEFCRLHEFCSLPASRPGRIAASYVCDVGGIY